MHSEQVGLSKEKVLEANTMCRLGEEAIGWNTENLKAMIGGKVAKKYQVFFRAVPTPIC